MISIHIDGHVGQGVVCSRGVLTHCFRHDAKTSFRLSFLTRSSVCFACTSALLTLWVSNSIRLFVRFATPLSSVNRIWIMLHDRDIRLLVFGGISPLEVSIVLP